MEVNGYELLQGTVPIFPSIVKGKTRNLKEDSRSTLKISNPGFAEYVVVVLTTV